jgi:SAM-dependent methyltransferase
MKYKKTKLTKLNLGCGSEYKEGWINLDIDTKWKTDILADVEKGIPLADNSIEEVFIKHVLEHLEPRKLSFVMSEICRICKNDSIIKIYVPYFSCSITYKSPDHITDFSYYTLDYTPGFETVKKRLYYFRESFGYKSKVMTLVSKVLNPILSFLPNLTPLVYERIFCWIFPMEELKIILKVKK